AITVSTILQHIRRGRIHSAHSLHEDFGELIEIDALETSPLIGKTLEEAELPSGVLIGAILRDEQFVIPYPYTVVEAGDRVVLFATSNAIKKVEKLFSVGLEYF
ncbi:MAG: Trk system potassium transport protein TrkA, partial [Alphaproteobacteria bacterium]|nr:Trk system potassium transport protein TrkA [Alphaproteobacteria bacterium]